MSHSFLGKSIRQTALTVLEREIISGCLLGDGTLTKAGKNYRLRIEHAFASREYVNWKFQLLKRLCVSDVQSVIGRQSWRFGTVGHPEITGMRSLWYNPIKQVPENLRLTPLMMAVWFMDDGTKHRDTVDFSIHSFSDESAQALRNQMLQLDVKTTINSDGKGKRLYVLKSSYPNFKKLVSPHMVTCMAYKLP